MCWRRVPATANLSASGTRNHAGGGKHEGAHRGAGRTLPARRLPVSFSGARRGRASDLPRRARTLRELARHDGAAGGPQVAHAAACPAAVVRRPRPPSAHPGRGRGRDRPRHPGVDRHLLHQGAELADLRGVAPGFDLFRARAARAGHGLGGADRCQPRGRLHGGAVGARRAAADASCGARARGQHQPRRPDHHRAARREPTRR